MIEMEWISIKDQPMPLQTHIIVSHPLGVDAIHFFKCNKKWTYWYSRLTVPKTIMESITHWFEPQIEK
jgi:hypothetical protein